MASKIKQLKDAVTEQNQMIVTLREKETASRRQLESIYLVAVDFQKRYIQEATSVESDTSYPSIRMEDLSKMPTPDVVRNLGLAFKAVMTGLVENRTELHSIYSELDLEVEQAMDAWQTIKNQDEREKGREAFRNNLLSQATPVRPKTPELTESAQTTPARSVPSPITPPDSTDSKDGRKDKVGKSKGGTTTLSSMLKSPTTPTASQQKKGTSKA